MGLCHAVQHGLAWAPMWPHPCLHVPWRLHGDPTPRSLTLSHPSLHTLPPRAHQLWVMEQEELQRGVDRAIISTGIAADTSPHKSCHPGLSSPTTAKATLAPPRDLLMTPPSSSLLHTLNTVTSPMMTAHTASQLLSPTALGLRPEGLELQRPRSALGGLVMPCSPVMAGSRGANGLVGLAGLGGGALSGQGCLAMDSIHTLEYPAASMMHQDPRHGTGGPGGERVVLGEGGRCSSQELRRQRQLQLQQDMDTSAPPPSAHHHHTYFTHDLSPLSPNELLVSAQALATSCMDGGLGESEGLMDVFGGHAHADVQLASPHLRVAPISTKRTH